MFIIFRFLMWPSHTKKDIPHLYQNLGFKCSFMSGYVCFLFEWSGFRCHVWAEWQKHEVKESEKLELNLIPSADFSSVRAWGSARSVFCWKGETSYQDLKTSPPSFFRENKNTLQRSCELRSFIYRRLCLLGILLWLLRQFTYCILVFEDKASFDFVTP